MINQNKREELIKLLDNSEGLVKLEDLFLFDLSPYYEDKEDNSFFYKQLEYIQDKNVLSHNSEISFTNEQKAIYDEIKNVSNKRLVISASTSFGKTMLIKEYIFNEQPNRVVFLVPTNSLADELVENFHLLFNKIGYTIFDTIKENATVSEKSIFIGTQEKYYQIYQNYNLTIDLFVIDEAYKLSDKINGSREVILNRTFIDSLRIAEKVILLLPLVNKINGIDTLNFKILKSDYAPIAKNFKVIENDDFDSEILFKIAENKENNLIYFDFPKSAEDFYLKKIKVVSKNNVLSNIWLERVQNDFHSEWIPLKAFKDNIGIHYGPMPKFIQKKVLNLFNSGQIKTILATSSIIEGVNTPTKNIFITTSKEILNTKHIIKFKNLIGRAGRLGIHKIGNIYYKKKHKKEFEDVNVSYKKIELDFIIEKPIQIVEINREKEFNSFKNSTDNEQKGDSFEINRSETVKYLKNSYTEKVPYDKIIDLLNHYGFTLFQFKSLIEYSNKKNINLFGIIGTLKSGGSGTDLYSINEIIDIKNDTFDKMIDELLKNKNFRNKEKPHLVSLIVKMIYNLIPHKIIPALDFVIELDELYKEYNGKAIFNKEVINEAKLKKVRFYNKFIGEENSKVEESKKIMTKLFEYGIPYFRVQKHFDVIASKVPDNFSIYDIKKIIFENESMKDLRIYFE